MDEMGLNMQKDEKYIKDNGTRPYRSSLTSLIETYQNSSSILLICSKTMFHCGELKGVMKNCDELLMKHFYMKELLVCYGLELNDLFDQEKESTRNLLFHQFNEEISSEESIRDLWKSALSKEKLCRKDEYSLKQRMNRQWEKVWKICEESEGSLLDLALILYVNYWMYPRAKHYPELFSKFIHFYMIKYQWVTQPLLVSQFIQMDEWKCYFKVRDDEEQVLGWIHYFIEMMNEIFEFQLNYIESIQAQLDEDFKKIESYVLGSKAKHNLIHAFMYFMRIPTSDTISLSKSLGVSYNTGATIMSQLEELCIISRVNYNQRNKNFYYRNYIENGLFEV